MLDDLGITPAVIPIGPVAPLIIEAQVSGAPTSVTVDFVPAGTRTTTIALHDDGASGVPGNSVSKWTANTNGQGVTLNLDARDDASSTHLTVWFTAPIGQLLTPGTYEDAGQYSTSTNGSLSLDGCYSPFGRFVVHDIAVSGTAVTRLAIDFEVHCQGNGVIIPPRPIVGSIRVNSTIPASIPLAIVFSGHGRIDVAPSSLVCTYNCTMTDVAGASIQLAATPDPGWSFVGWGSSPACAGGAVTLTAPTECRPTFQPVP